MPAVSPVRRRSGADSSDAWELHRANTERPSDDIAFANPLRPLPFSFRFLTEMSLAEIVGFLSAHALLAKIIEP